MLQNLSVRNWLGDIEPAWTLLDQASFDALQRPPHPILGPIRLTYDLPVEDIQRSAVTRNTLILLRAAAEGPGLKMTATGNLSRGVVAEMCELFTWPGFDKAEAFRLHKVINEPDFLPLFFVRHVAEAGKLVRRDKGHLKVTPAGQKLLKEPHQKALQAVLFHLALWRLDLGYLGRGLHHGWPQHDIGSRRTRLDHTVLAKRLEGAVSYDRIAGYFRSSLFEVAGEAITKVGGPVRIICNSDLDPQDLVTAAAAQAALRRSWCSGKPEDAPPLAMHRYQALYDALTNKKMEVRVLPDSAFGLIHGKAGVLRRSAAPS